MPDGYEKTIEKTKGNLFMEVLYKSTRSDGTPVTASQAILKGLSEDGGLFVPDHIPTLDKSLSELSNMTYKETAYEVMKLFLTDFTEEELKTCIDKAYDSKFDTDVIAPLVEADGVYFLELFHGATIAFKDMALSILPHLLITAAKKNQVKNEIVILTATSGGACGICRSRGYADHRILSKERGKPDSGKTDGHTKGCEHACGRHPRKF